MTKPKYLVFNLTNYNYGFEMCGLYTTQEEAEKRLNWLVKRYGEASENSFHLVPLTKHKIRQELEQTYEDFEEE